MFVLPKINTSLSGHTDRWVNQHRTMLYLQEIKNVIFIVAQMIANICYILADNFRGFIEEE